MESQVHHNLMVCNRCKEARWLRCMNERLRARAECLKAKEPYDERDVPIDCPFLLEHLMESGA